jgi:ribosomal protein S25
MLPRATPPEKRRRKNATTKDAIERAESWPDETQAELAAIALEIDASIREGVHRAIQRSLRVSTEGSGQRGKGGSRLMRK